MAVGRGRADAPIIAERARRETGLCLGRTCRGGAAICGAGRDSGNADARVEGSGGCAFWGWLSFWGVFWVLFVILVKGTDWVFLKIVGRDVFRFLFIV